MMTDATFCAKNRGVRDDDERRSVEASTTRVAPTRHSTTRARLGMLPRHNTHTRDGNASQRLSRVTTSLARRQVPSPTNALAPERAAARTRRFQSRFAFRALRDFPDFPDLEGHGVLREEVLALRRLGNHAQERLQRQTRDREQGGEQDGHREAELALALWSFGARPEAKSQSERTQGNDVFRHDRPIVRVGKNRDAIALDVVVAMGGRARAPRARARPRSRSRQ